MQKQIDVAQIYEAARKEIELLMKDYKQHFVDFHLACGCEKVVAKGLCNCANRQGCPENCPVKRAAFIARENINSGLRKKPQWERTVASNGVQIMKVYENPKAKIAEQINGSYNETKVREIYFTACSRCKDMHTKTHTPYNCEKCLVKMAFQERMKKLRGEKR